MKLVYIDLNLQYGTVKDVFSWRLHGLFSGDIRYHVINTCKSIYVGSYLGHLSRYQSTLEGEGKRKSES